MNVVLVPVDGDVTVETIPDAGTSGHLTALQALVGGYVEIVRTFIPFAEALVNEDGMPRDLEYNERASVLAQRGIVGPMVIVGPVNNDGDWTDVPMGMVEFVNRHARCDICGEGKRPTCACADYV